MISPAEFIPVAEETGLIDELGEWVLRRACAEAASWPDHVQVAVNVSPVQFNSQALCAQRRQRRWRPRALRPRRLELEITEAVLIRDDEARAGRAAPAARRSACASRWTISAPAIPR